MNEYTFAKSLEKLVKTQEQEIEMAVLDRGNTNCVPNSPTSLYQALSGVK